MENAFQFGIDQLTVASASAMARGKLKGSFSDLSVRKIKKGSEAVENIVANDITVYGVNTGFGILAQTKISSEDAAVLQHKILQSHSVGVGDPIPAHITRLMLITKLHALAQGYSGIRLATLERILWHLETNILPVVPAKG